MNPWTIDKLVKSIRNYPSARSLLLQSKSRAPIASSKIKKIISTLLSGDILKMDHHRGLKTTIFGLARKVLDVHEFALNDYPF